MYNIAIMLTFALWDITNAQYNCKPRDCYDLKCFRVSTAKDGPHTIYPDSSTLTSLNVSCDQETDNGGWVMYQRRVDGTLNFTQSWEDYKHGSGTNGDGTTELWLGNEKAYHMVHSYGKKWKGQLRIEADAFDGRSCWLVASDFRMYSENHRYKVDWGRVTESESGIAGDWNFHERYSFKTYDNVDAQAQCLRDHKGGWWYGHGINCTRLFLNGEYVKQADATSTSIAVRSFKPNTALQRSRMMFRRTKERPCLNPCKNGGTCDHVANPEGIRCRCASQFCGEKCEILNPCQNNGTCEYNTTTNSTSCKCTTGFPGPICEDATSDDATTTSEAATTTSEDATPTSEDATTTSEDATSEDDTSENVVTPAIIALVVGLVLLLRVVAAGVCIEVISNRRRNEKNQREQRQFAEVEDEEEDEVQDDDVMSGLFSIFGMDAW